MFIVSSSTMPISRTYGFGRNASLSTCTTIDLVFIRQNSSIVVVDVGNVSQVSCSSLSCVRQFVDNVLSFYQIELVVEILISTLLCFGYFHLCSLCRVSELLFVFTTSGLLILLELRSLSLTCFCTSLFHYHVSFSL